MSQIAEPDRRFDADHLLNLARQKSCESRSRLAALVVDLFDSPDQVLNENEHSLIYRILHDVILDIEMSARRVISTQIAGRKDVPKDLVVALANDKIEVAHPILTRSTLIQDEDLIEVVRFRSHEHQLAVAARESIGESVTDELVSTGKESVIVTLLKNKSATIAGRTMEYLVEQSQRVNALRQPILMRKELDPRLAKRMFVWVSLALREHIIAHFDIDRQDVDDLIERTIAVETERLADAPNGQDRKAAELAEAMETDGLLTPDMLIAALQETEFPLFVAMFGRLSGLRDYLVMRLTFEPSGEGLAIACKAIGIGKATFATLYSLARRGDKTADSSDDALAPALKFYDSFSVEAARTVLRQWRRGTDYQNAVRVFVHARGADGGMAVTSAAPIGLRETAS